MKHFAVMGNPIEHSLSPYIHQYFAEQEGIELSYEKIEVSNELHFEEKLLHFFSEGGSGLNITLPFKQRAFVIAEESTARCSQAKAANTIWQSSGRLKADNTDGIGLIRDLSTYLELAEKRVLLLGAGGAARGIIGPLIEAKIEQLFLVSRRVEQARLLQKDFPQIQSSTLEELTENFDLIINATSASLTAKNWVLPTRILKSSTFCYDLAYLKTGPTVFVDWAQKQGLQATDGLGMLVEQAAESFFIWHKQKPDARAALKKLKTKLESIK